MSLKNRTVSGPERINLEHVKCLPPVLINMLVRLFTRFPLDCKAPKEWKTSRIVILYKKDDTQDIGSYRPIRLLSAIYKFFTRVILNRIEKTLDDAQSCKQAGF
ncbi:hypothetical protein RB195_001256 [Necator americanus]|uniref:Reverse transcriptase domain-containing protein n=1 Tax=Necator americanus TaxID=51031 RepID=A0ABR1DEP1_NECAM